jgi:hypothetical protein
LLGFGRRRVLFGQPLLESVHVIDARIRRTVTGQAGEVGVDLGDKRVVAEAVHVPDVVLHRPRRQRVALPGWHDTVVTSQPSQLGGGRDEEKKKNRTKKRKKKKKKKNKKNKNTMSGFRTYAEGAIGKQPTCRSVTSMPSESLGWLMAARSPRAASARRA